MNKVESDRYVRINKCVAINLYKKGKTIYLLPCNTRIGNMWVSPYAINIFDGEDYSNFSRVVEIYEYYNCNNELGRYASYYVREEDVA